MLVISGGNGSKIYEKIMSGMDESLRKWVEKELGLITKWVMGIKVDHYISPGITFYNEMTVSFFCPNTTMIVSCRKGEEPAQVRVVKRYTDRVSTEKKVCSEAEVLKIIVTITASVGEENYV